MQFEAFDRIINLLRSFMWTGDLPSFHQKKKRRDGSVVANDR